MNSMGTTLDPRASLPLGGDRSDDALFGGGFDLRGMMALLRRHWRAMALIVVAALALGIVATLLMVPRYVAQATVVIEQQADQIIEDSTVSDAPAQTDVERFLQTQVDVLNSRELAGRVVAEEKLAEDPKFFEAIQVVPDTDALPAAEAHKLRERAAIAGLLENLRINLPRQSRVISVGFESADPAVSARVADSVARNFIDGNLRRKYDSSGYARRFLQQQLQDTRVELERSERDLNRFSRAAGLIRLAGNAKEGSGDTALSVTNESLVQSNVSANAAVAERVAAQNRWENIAHAAPLSIPQVLANSSVQNLLEQRSTIEGELAKERARHLDDHPSVQALQAQIAALDRQLGQIASSIRQSVYVEYRVAQDRERALKGSVEQLRASALTEQDRGVQYNILKRVAETNRALYDALLDRYNKLNASAGSAANNVSLLDSAEAPTIPHSPSLARNLILALLLGLVAACLYVFIRVQFADGVNSPADVEEKLGVRLLGLIPLAVDGDVAVQSGDRKTPIGEAYGSLVTNLSYSTDHGLPRTLAITSATASEGKSTSAMAVARDLAHMGKSVVLIDADMRRPTLQRSLGLTAKQGLSDLLTGQAKIDEVLQTVEGSALHFITAGPKPPQPSMLLGGPQLRRVLESVSERFDVAILDCPPMLGLADSAVLAAHCEGVLFVIDGSKARRATARSSLDRLALVRAQVVGAVLTKFDPRKTGNEYDYYGYDYYRYEPDAGQPA